jgi:hypothetical protein
MTLRPRAPPGELRIDGDEIVVSTGTGADTVVYEGRQLNEGQFHLRSSDPEGTAVGWQTRHLIRSLAFQSVPTTLKTRNDVIGPRHELHCQPKKTHDAPSCFSCRRLFNHHRLGESTAGRENRRRCFVDHAPHHHGRFASLTPPVSAGVAHAGESRLSLSRSHA